MSGLLVTASAAPPADPEGTITRRDMLASCLMEYAATEQEIVALEAWLTKSDARIAEGREWLFANPEHPQTEENYKRWCAWGAHDFEKACLKKDLEAKNAARSQRAIAVWDKMSLDERTYLLPKFSDLPGWAIWSILRDAALLDGKAGPDVSF